MADESITQPGVETESSVPENVPDEVSEIEAGADDGTEDADTDADSESDGDDADGEADGEGAPEVVEFNFGGVKFSVPKGSVPEELTGKISEFIRTAEGQTTKRLQEVAEIRKSLEADRAAVQKLTNLNDDLLTTFTRGKQIRSELDQFAQVNFEALWQSNPDQARRLSDIKAQKQAEFDRVLNEVAQKEHAFTEAQNAEVGKQREAGRQAVAKQIPDFEAKVLPKVIDYAVKTLGLDPDTAANDWPLNPAMVIAVHKAQQYDEMQARAKLKPKAPTQQVKPTTPIRGKGGSGVRDVSKMSAAEMAKHLGLPG